MNDDIQSRNGELDEMSDVEALMEYVHKRLTSGFDIFFLYESQSTITRYYGSFPPFDNTRIRVSDHPQGWNARNDYDLLVEPGMTHEQLDTRIGEALAWYAEEVEKELEEELSWSEDDDFED